MSAPQAVTVVRISDITIADLAIFMLKCYVASLPVIALVLGGLVLLRNL
jgi:hypothetical protein